MPAIKSLHRTERELTLVLDKKGEWRRRRFSGLGTLLFPGAHTPLGGIPRVELNWGSWGLAPTDHH